MGVVWQSDDQMGSACNGGCHREDANEELGVLGVIPLCDSVGISRKLRAQRGYSTAWLILLIKPSIEPAMLPARP
jgi:hypothetical protein